MPSTVIGVGDPKAVKRWSQALAYQTAAKEFWSRFESTSDDAFVHRQTALEDGPGDEVSYDIVMDIRGDVVVGDNRLKGTEEQMQFYTDRVRIDQARKALDRGARMTQQRTLHDLRTVARNQLAQYLARWLDEMKFAYASGDVGLTAINPRVYGRVDFAGNPLQAPDADHQMFGGTATSRVTLTTSDVMSNALIERCAVKTQMMTAVNPDVIRMMPVSIPNTSKEMFMLLISPYQAFTLRTATGDASWLRMQQAIATSDGRDNPMIKGGIGIVAGVCVWEHENVLRWSNGGAGQNLPWARAILMGRQALCVAYGANGGRSRMKFYEEMDDYDNLVSFAGGFIVGVKKTRHNGLDRSVVAVDTYAINPNP